MSDKVHDKVVAAHPELEKGDKEYPGKFQKALTTLMKELTAEEMAEMEKTREEWQGAGPPIDVRLKSVLNPLIQFYKPITETQCRQEIQPERNHQCPPTSTERDVRLMHHILFQSRPGHRSHGCRLVRWFHHGGHFLY